MKLARVTLLCKHCGKQDTIDATYNEVDKIYVSCYKCMEPMMIMQIDIVSESKSGEKTTKTVARLDEDDIYESRRLAAIEDKDYKDTIRRMHEKDLPESILDILWYL